jgi:branched-chain amino acid transport system permease protein
VDQLLQQIVAGLEFGSSYSLIGLAIVVVMKSTDVPNFAMAEMGLVVAYMGWFLSGDPGKGAMGWPFWPSMALALLVAVAFGAATQFFLIRPLTGLPNQPLAVLVGVGLGFFSIGYMDDSGFPSWLDWLPVTDGGFPLAVAIILAIPLGALLYVGIRKLVMPLPAIDHFPLLLLTIGLTFALGSFIENVWGATPQRFDAPWSSKTFNIGDTRIGWDQVVAIGVGFAVALGLAAFFRSKWGVRMRAIAEDGATARMLGINAGAVSLIAWSLGTLVAGAAMIVNTSSTVLELGSAEGLILKGFIAAVLGGFTSLTGTFFGGLLIGVAEALAGGQISTSLQPTIALLIVVLVLLASPGGLSRQAKLREV